MKKLSFSVLFMTIALIFFQHEVKAVIAYPYPIEYAQPDGSIVTLTMKGDEKVHWAETLDGYTLLRNKKGAWEYAVIDKKGDLVCSGVMAKEITKRTTTDNLLLKRTPKKLKYSKSQVGILRQIANLKSVQVQNAKAQTAFPNSGTINNLLILIGFNDKPFTKSLSDFDNLMNQNNYNNTGSFKDFYFENSYGNLTINTTVAGAYTAANSWAYYGTNTPSDDYNVDELVSEAITLADNDGVDFSEYDNDDDGNVDGIYIIYAGFGEEAGGGDDAIWAHASGISPLTFDGVNISKYACSSELRGNSGTEITGIGVICHEFGHSLGARDYYDTDYDNNGQYPGNGSWDVMSGGSWNNGGDTPAHHNPFTKINYYNWATATVINNAQNVTLRDATTYTDFVQINTNTANEYFLCENRQLNGFNTALEGHGMLIYHVDGSYIAAHDWNNYTNAGAHQGMYMVSASATTSNGVMVDGDINLNSCPWPGTGNKTTFDDTTTPNSKSWNDDNTDKAILNISENGGNITFCLIACDQNTPTNFDANTFSSSQINLSWILNGNSNPVLIVFNTINSFGTPVNGTFYSKGNSISVGGTVIFTGGGTSYNHTTLSPNTTYYYKIWSILSGNNYSAGIATNASTFCNATELPFTETFDGTTIPSCWSQIDHQGDGQIWKFGATSSGSLPPSYPSPALSGNYAYLNSDEYGSAGTQNVDLVSPTLDLSGYTSINLQFNHFFSQFYLSKATLSYSIDDGSNWTQIQQWTTTTANPVSFNQDIAALDNQSQAKLKWNFTGSFEFVWAIDNISITGISSVPENLPITENVGSGTFCFDAQNDITIAANTPVVFSSGSNVTLIAGNSIRFLPGFHAEQGCAMDAYITTTNSFCNELQSGAIVSQPQITIQKAELFEKLTANIDKEQHINLYPNPNNGNFNVELVNYVGSSDIIIRNILGVCVYKSTINNNITEMVLPYLQKGLYFMNVKNGNKVLTTKFLKQ